MTTKSVSAVVLLTLMAASGASAQVNMGGQKAEASLPFNMTKVASFDTQIWRMAFLPDGRLLVTERPGRMRIVGADEMHLVSEQTLEANPDVGLDVLHDVADVERPVGVGQRGRDEQALLDWAGGRRRGGACPGDGHSGTACRGQRAGELGTPQV